MKKENIIYSVLLGVVFLLLIYLVGSSLYNPNTNTAKVVTEDVNAKLQGSGYESVMSDGVVSIELTPQGFADGKLYVDMVVNTHSVSLDQFDLKKIVTMELDGEILKPSETPQLSGHHSGGILVFDTGREPESFKITIVSIPDVEKRTFEW